MSRFTARYSTSHRNNKRKKWEEGFLVVDRVKRTGYIKDSLGKTVGSVKFDSSNPVPTPADYSEDIVYTDRLCYEILDVATSVSKQTASAPVRIASKKAAVAAETKKTKKRILRSKFVAPKQIIPPEQHQQHAHQQPKQQQQSQPKQQSKQQSNQQEHLQENRQNCANQNDSTRNVNFSAETSQFAPCHSTGSNAGGNTCSNVSVDESSSKHRAPVQTERPAKRRRRMSPLEAASAIAVPRSRFVLQFPSVADVCARPDLKVDMRTFYVSAYFGKKPQQKLRADLTNRVAREFNASYVKLASVYAQNYLLYRLKLDTASHSAEHLRLHELLVRPRCSKHSGVTQVKFDQNTNELKYRCARHCSFVCSRRDAEIKAVLGGPRESGSRLDSFQDSKRFVQTVRRAGVHLYHEVAVCKYDNDECAIHFRDDADLEDKKAYSKHDLWVLSKFEDFSDAFFLVATDYARGEKQVRCRPIEARLGPTLCAPVPSGRDREDFCYFAIRVDNMRTELAALKIMHTLDTLPLTPVLAQMATKTEADLPADPLSADMDMRHYETAVRKFNLNQQQAAVLTQARNFFENDARVLLVDGCFGAGKSTTLAALIHMLCGMLQGVAEEDGATDTVTQSRQVMLAAVTNVAVDSVLRTLSPHMAQLARFGSAPRVARDLRDALILNESAQAQEAPVVATTCAATQSEHFVDYMQDRECEILVLDEASQLQDIVAMLPIAGSKCRRLVCFGDFRQLPPTLRFEMSLFLPPLPWWKKVPPVPSTGDHLAIKSTLSFRLDRARRRQEKNTCVILSTKLLVQHRCHARIADVASRLFYGARVQTAPHVSRRPLLLPQVPPTVLVDCRGAETRLLGGSPQNIVEAKVIADFVKLLLSRGIKAAQIGVVTFYRAQVEVLRKLLETCEDKPQVATVDSFQGGEKEIIVLSPTRSSSVSGFLAMAQRVNVALTRAKSHLFVVGHLACLSKDETWKQLTELVGQGARITATQLPLLLGSEVQQKQDKSMKASETQFEFDTEVDDDDDSDQDEEEVDFEVSGPLSSVSSNNESNSSSNISAGDAEKTQQQQAEAAIDAVDVILRSSMDDQGAIDNDDDEMIDF